MEESKEEGKRNIKAWVGGALIAGTIVIGIPLIVPTITWWFLQPITFFERFSTLIFCILEFLLFYVLVLKGLEGTRLGNELINKKKEESNKKGEGGMRMGLNEEKEKREWLDNEIDEIMKKDIQKVIMVCLQSGIPCDPETSDAKKEIEVCLERLKKEAEK